MKINPVKEIDAKAMEVYSHLEITELPFRLLFGERRESDSSRSLKGKWAWYSHFNKTTLMCTITCFIIIIILIFFNIFMIFFNFYYIDFLEFLYFFIQYFSIFM